MAAAYRLTMVQHSANVQAGDGTGSNSAKISVSTQHTLAKPKVPPHQPSTPTDLSLCVCVSAKSDLVIS
jgi:hypothetical protein